VRAGCELPSCVCADSADAGRKPHLQFGQGAHRRARNGGVGITGLALQLHADLIGLLLVGQPRQRLDRLDANVLLIARQQRQQQVDGLGVAELAEARTTTGTARALPARSISYMRGTARLLPISASASIARSLTHQSASLVASIR
jgi:hypothetical protein